VGRTPWLLVLDDTNDPDILFGTSQLRGILDYLPTNDLGRVVYTTRTLEIAASLRRSDVIKLRAMNEHDAASFLEKSLIRKEVFRDSTATTELLDELHGLPLAIAQAAAYSNRNNVSIMKYSQLLRNTEQDHVSLLSREFRDDTRYTGLANAVINTWFISFTQIRARDAEAAMFLAFMSCIEWKSIPRSLLPSVQSIIQMRESIGTLCAYSFLTVRENGDQGEGREEKWYDIHQLVHLATTIWIRKHADPAKVNENAIRHVAEVFPSDDYTNRVV
jgi:hypothetical protein